MRRVPMIAAFLLFLALLPVSAQRGGMRGGASGGRSFVGHPSPPVRSGGPSVGSGFVGHPGAPAFSGVHSGGVHVGFASRSFSHSGSHSVGFGERGFRHGRERGSREDDDREDGERGSHRHHHCFGCGRFGYPYGYAYGYGAYGYGGYYDPFLSESFDAADYRFDQEQARELALAEEMNRLSIEEQRLREREDAFDREREEETCARQAEANARWPQTQQQASSQPAPGIVLVFRDRHQQEVQNYAIADHTLWVLTAQSAKKIPLSELDLDATRKLNEERGVEFATPR